MNIILEINVVLDEIRTVKGKYTEVTSITFHGTAHSSLFQGNILPGAVDTQTKVGAGPNMLSARYVLEGKDFQGNPCQIYVENTASGDSGGVTHPKLVTDSEALQWLEQAQLEGKLTHQENGILITIYEKKVG